MTVESWLNFGKVIENVLGKYKEEAHMSQRYYAMLPVIQNFAKSLKVT